MKVPFTLAIACLSAAAWAQSNPKDSEWPTYGADLANSKYRPLDQINASNFSKLEVAWRFKTDSLGPRPEYKLEATPLMVKGVVYASVGTRRAVVALDAATGELLWSHGEHEGARGAAAPRQLSGRGVSYWTDGREERILYVTPGYRLVALNAKTGAPVPSFGKEGMVDLKQGAVFGNWEPIDLEKGEIGLHSTPAVTKDVVIVGSSFRVDKARNAQNAASPSFVIAASEPPASMMSASSYWIVLYASMIAFPAVAHAVAVADTGPLRPH